MVQEMPPAAPALCGPQFLLSSIASERVLVGLSLGLNKEVSAFINAAHALNPEFGASLVVMSLGHNGVTLNPSVRSAAQPPDPAHLDQCIRSCAIHFLGLQNNKFAVDLFTGRASDKQMYSRGDQEQVYNRFPNQENRQNKASFRNGVDERVASVSNECITACIEKSFLGFLGGFVTGFKMMPGEPTIKTAVGTGVGIVAGSMAGLACSGTSACSKSREQEKNEQERGRLKAENDLREERARKEELDRKDQEKKDQERKKSADIERERKNADAKKQESEQREKQKRDMEDKIERSFDRSNNKDEKVDSSASCETTKTCDGTMNATIIPEKYRELKGDSVSRDRNGKIITPLEMAGTPMPKDIQDDLGASGSGGYTDSNGNVLAELDLTGTPMPKTELSSGGPRTDRNGKIITKLDMVGNPGIRNIDNSNSPFIPTKNMGFNLNTMGSK